MNKALEKQMKATKKALSPTAMIYDGLSEFYKLIKLFYEYLEETMKEKSKGEKKVKKVMEEYKSGELHSGSKRGPIVTNAKQAIAIGLSEARKAGAKVAKKK